jgi:hypothetical protein
MMNGNGHGHVPGKEPAERVIELFVHTPIGLAVMAWKRVPELVVGVPGLVGQAVSKGCAQLAEAEKHLSEEVRKARMIGQVAVTFGGRQLRREVDARLRDARQAAGGVAGFIPGRGTAGAPNGTGDSPPPTAPAPGPGEPAAARQAPTTPTATAGPPRPGTAKVGPPRAPGTAKAGAARAPGTAKAGAAKAPGTAKATPAKAPGTAKAAPAKAPAKAAKAARRPATPAAAPPASAADLPLREYDGLSASQVVSRLTGLTPGELRAVRAYEDASRGRRTVLLAIERLLG